MKKLIALVAFAAFALSTTASAQDISFVNGNWQGVYYGAASTNASQTFGVEIEPYTHVDLQSTTGGMDVDPGGEGWNVDRYDNTLRYATNYAPGTATVSVEVTGGADAFDEVEFHVYKPGNADPVVEDLAAGGSVGTFHAAMFNASSTGPQTFISDFGQVVATAKARYDVRVSDVAVQGDRTFDVVFTIQP